MSLAMSSPIYLDLEKERITMDRTKSGLIDFGTKATPHDRESNDWRDRDGVNYQKRLRYRHMGSPQSLHREDL